MKKTEVNILKSGYCTGKENHIIKGGINKTCKFYAGYALIKHPEKGYILFDTGYSMEFFEATKFFPYNLYAKTTPVYFSEEDYEINLNYDEIKYVIISHFHADHICGLKKYKKAKFICNKKEYLDIKNKKGLCAVKQGFIPSLLPQDFDQRVLFIEDISKKIDVEPFENCWDIFLDESIFAIELNGHTKGQIGLLLETENKKLFLISDACWTQKSFKENLPPPSYILNFLGEKKTYLETLKRIHQFHNSNKDVEIIPAHCPEYWSKING